MDARAQAVAVELSFDSASEDRLRGIWAQLERHYVKRGVAELGIRPHVSLAVFRTGTPVDLEGLVASLAANLRSFRLDLGQVSAFPTSEGVVFLEPVASPELLAAHRILMALLGDAKSLVDPYYREDVWMPHCTVAIGVHEQDLSRVIDACRSANALGPVKVCRVSAVQYRPTVELHTSEIQGHARPVV